MTTATPSKPQTKPGPAKILFQGLIALDKIDAGSNIRKAFDPVKLAELTESVREHGVNQPILLRPSTKEGRYQLIAGARRIEASKNVGLKDIPAIVKDYSDERAPLAQAIENLQREDLNPIDEARGFKCLLDALEYSAEQLSEQIDKSIAYVHRAVRLLELPENVIDAIEKGKWTPAHGHQLLRIAAGDRDELIKTWISTWEFQNGGQTTAKHLRNYIDRQLGEDLSKALFTKTKPYAGELACSACPYNSGNQGQLFDGAEKGICSKSSCFEKKTEQHWEDIRSALAKRFPSAVVVKSIPGYLSVSSEMDGLVMREVVKEKTKLREGGSIYHSQQSGSTFAAYAVPKKKSSTATQSKPQKADPKIEFIQEAEWLSIGKALAAASKKLTKKHLVAILEQTLENGSVENGVVEKILGFGLEPGKMSETELAQALTLVVAVDWQGIVDEDIAEDLGVKIAAVKKTAKVEAEKAWANSWGRKHLSTANSGSETACGLKTLNYKTATEKGIAVPMDKDVTCPDCKKSAYMKR